jgi:regulation of enolase protein 1 (concanavalin A-like superfamily)
MTGWEMGLEWLNPPPSTERRDDGLLVRTGHKTDFWRGTFYDFFPDSGHLLGRAVEGDFTATVSFSGDYQALYDQAGVMARVDDRHWIKAGIEYYDGIMNLSVVVTNENSDWSVIPLPGHEGKVTVRLSRHAEAVRVQYLDGSIWRLARLAWLRPAPSLFVGAMCCSPQREGFEVTFHDVAIGPPIARDLHA